METSHNFTWAQPLGTRQNTPAIDSIAGGQEALLNELLASPDCPPDLLRAALAETRRQFENLLSVVSGTFFRCQLTPPFNLEFPNSQGNSITGYPLDSITSEIFSALIHPEDIEGHRQIIALAIRDKTSFDLTYRLMHKSGQYRWVRSQGKAYYDERGRPQFFEGFVVDVTEKKEFEIAAEDARRDVQALNARLANILEGTLDSVLSFDPDLNLTYANERAIKEIQQNGYPDWSGDVLVLDRLRKSPFWNTISLAMQEGKPKRAELYSTDTNIWFDVYAMPDGNGGIILFYRDISDRKKLEEDKARQAEDLQTTLDSLPDMVWATDGNGIGQYYNRALADFIGGSQEAFLSGHRVPEREFVHPHDRNRAAQLWKETLKLGQTFQTELRMRHHSGKYRWVLARAWPQRNERGEIVKWYGSATDIHDRILSERKLRESEILQGSFLDSTPDYVVITDLEGKVLMLNTPAMRGNDLLDTSVMLGRRWTDFWPIKKRSSVRRAIRKSRDGEVARFSAPALSSNGEKRWHDVTVSPIHDENGNVRRLLSIIRDITDLKATEERLRLASEEDSLTSLPNRRAFKRRLSRAIAKARDRGDPFGLMLIDLDHFKHVNDAFGHLAGDHLLRVTAKRLSACVSDSGFVARLGGDEFAIVLTGIRDEMELVSAATQVLAKLNGPVAYSGKPLGGGVSIGCAMFPRDATEALGLLKHADMALYDLKASARGGIQMFNTELKEASERTTGQLTAARKVIQDDTAEPFYQPKIRLDDGTLCGFEALLRWWCPGNGMQLPGTVAEAFNDYELSTKIGGLMQGRVFTDISNWLEAGLKVPSVSINASPAEFLRDDYAEKLLSRIADHGFSPSLIEVEITEHAFDKRRSQQVIRALKLLKQEGIGIALDDFGTGYSSLSHLRDFPVDVLKIDRSFINRMLNKDSMLAVVEAISKLGPSLSLEIVAEGVETPEQLEALRNTGCTMGQGYLFAKAMDAEAAALWLEDGKWPLSSSARKRSGPCSKAA